MIAGLLYLLCIWSAGQSQPPPAGTGPSWPPRPDQSPAAVRYSVGFPNAAHHEARIEARFPDLTADTLSVRMSRSSPGRYSLHEFVKNVYRLEAFDGEGRPLPVRRPDPFGWDIGGHDGTVVVRYTLYADRADGTYAGIDLTHAHLNMPATFIWARGLESRPIVVSFDPPAGSGWRVATQLAATADPLTFTAPDLDYFLDSPAELSDFTLVEWPVTSGGGREYTIRMAVHHAGARSDVESFAAITRPVVQEARGVFGDFPEFDFGSYTFIADYLPHAYGDGMEHRNSTVLTSSRSLDRAALDLLGTVSHEFVHAWNVERARPRSLEPFDFEGVNMSRELWFAEGFTSYYDDLLIRRAGLIGDREYARRLGDLLNQVLNAPGPRYFSLVEMSMQAALVDRATFNDPTNYANTFLSYYSWGAAVALALDLTLQSRFGTDLDAYMRAVWARHGAPERPYTVEDLEGILADVSGDEDFAAEFFSRYIYGGELPDFAPLLAGAGYALRRSRPGEAVLGWAELDFGRGGAEVRSATLVGSPLYLAGVDRGDRILSLAGRRITRPADLQAELSARTPGDVVEIEYVQRGRMRRAEPTLEENPALEVVAFEDASLPMPPETVSFREAWLGSRAGR